MREGEYLLVEWAWRGDFILAEQVSAQIARPEDAFAHLNDDTFRIHIFRPRDETMDRCEDVTETIAGAWIGRHDPDPRDPGALPAFVRGSIAWSDRCDAFADHSVNGS
ncbi:MAG: hypothetical protein AB7F30_06205 [Flavobacteriaceae bacterium]